MWMFVDRVIEKFISIYRKRVFLDQIGCRENKACSLVGKVYVINKNIKLGNNVTIYPNVLFHGDGEIVIGNNVSIGNDTIIYSSRNGGVYIGNDVAIAAHCYIIDSDHGIVKGELMRKQDLVSKKIVVGNDVWIADNCTVLKGSIINDVAVIGAKSLVNKEIDRNAIAVGIPTRIVKYRE